PAESTSAETTSEESTPAESTSSETTSEESTSSESTSAETTPEVSTTAESTSSETSPEESTPAESTSAETTSEESTPAESTSSETTSEESTSSESTSAETTPEVSTTAETTLEESTSSESTLVESLSSSSTSVETSAISTSAETTPYLSSSVISTSHESSFESSSTDTFPSSSTFPDKSIDSSKISRNYGNVPIMLPCNSPNFFLSFNATSQSDFSVAFTPSGGIYDSQGTVEAISGIITQRNSFRKGFYTPVLSSLRKRQSKFVTASVKISYINSVFSLSLNGGTPRLYTFNSFTITQFYIAPISLLGSYSDGLVTCL
ncbi:hypothetical protein AYI68_g7647, partial [Smittium mucronatum]